MTATGMRPGIFSTVFDRPTLDETLAAVRRAGVDAVQFDLESVGLSMLPDEIPKGLPGRIRAACADQGVAISALSGTFNMAHPDAAFRERELARFRVLAAAAGPMGAPVITICTGTRDPDDMWRYHPDNGTPAAWADLLATLGAALGIAGDHDLTLAFEPEPANVVRDAQRGRALLDELRHPRLAVVMDPANILAGAMDRAPDDALSEAFDLLGDRIVATHAKDIDAAGRFRAAGKGIVPWARHVELLRGIGFDGPLVLHSLVEGEVAGCVEVLRRAIGDPGGAA